ncbi:MAG: putative bifunctional diguanylate cyclase/phosphodiesterase, partial [Caulobacteraceae bacterium]
MLKSKGVEDPQIQQRLVAALFTRISSLLMAASCELIVGVTALVVHPRPVFFVWFGLSLSFLLIRLGLLTWCARQVKYGRPTPTSLVVSLSLVWISIIGFGCLVCDLSGYNDLQVLSNICVTAILGGLIARNASTPRLAIAQVAVALTFVCVGAWLAPQHWLRILILQAPIYAVGLSGMCYKLNRELVALLQAQRDNADLARADTLTGLPNRVSVAETLDAVVARSAAPSGRPARFAVICMDLDGFKAINDTLGHTAGDMVLVETGRRLRQSCTDALMVSRLGGDEFLAVLSDPIPGQAESLARVIGEAVRRPFLLPGAPSVLIDASFGVAHFPQDGRDADAVLIAAAKALYAVKRSGKGDVASYDRARHAGESDLLGLRGDLDKALQADAPQLVLDYQPIQGSQDGLISGREALVRWLHPVRGLIGPGDFIPMAETSGLIIRLGEVVLRRACLDAVAWADAVGVAVNVSPVQLRNDKLATAVMSALEISGLPASRLEIEVTETALLGDDAVTRSNMEAIRALGVKLVLDDFGTGYSSLANLCRFTFDRIKVDGSFVRVALHHKESAAVVRATVALAGELGVPTTAECIETIEQLEFVRACGCTDVQGYLLGKPAANASIPCRSD